MKITKVIAQPHYQGPECCLPPDAQGSAAKKKKKETNKKVKITQAGQCGKAGEESGRA